MKTLQPTRAGFFRMAPKNMIITAALAASIIGIPILGTYGYLYITHSQIHSTHNTLPASYAPVAASVTTQRIMYEMQREPAGYMLEQVNAQNISIPLGLLTNRFGADDSDIIAAVKISPNYQYVAIDGSGDHGDFVWIYNTATKSLAMTPSNAIGSFLNWMPDGQHFLFKPFIPMGPNPSAWNEGVWIVNASDGSHVNLALPQNLTSSQLVDAISAPSGSSLLLSVSEGLGLGSEVWSMGANGSQPQQVFSSKQIVGLFNWAPNGKRLAYQTIQDSDVAFQTGGLWLMNAANAQRTYVAAVDGGHGYTVSWSPNSENLAFVARLNTSSQTADSQAGALISAIQNYSLMSSAVTTIAGPQQTGEPRNIQPNWTTNNNLVFTSMAASAQKYGAALTSADFWLVSAQGAVQANNVTTPLFTLEPLTIANSANVSAMYDLQG